MNFILYLSKNFLKCIRIFYLMQHIHIMILFLHFHLFECFYLEWWLYGSDAFYVPKVQLTTQSDTNLCKCMTKRKTLNAAAQTNYFSSKWWIHFMGWIWSNFNWLHFEKLYENIQIFCIQKLFQKKKKIKKIEKVFPNSNNRPVKLL